MSSIKKTTFLASSILAGSLFATLFYTDKKAGQAIICDLGGVLIHTNKIAALQELGIGSLCWYMLTTQQSPTALKSKFYEILDRIQPDGNYCEATDEDNVLLPGLMCDWLRGTKSSKEIRTLIITHINKNPEWFYNATEQTLVKRLARFIFTPSRFVNTRTLSKRGIACIKQYKEKGYSVYILSNWDPESFELMRQKHADFFDLFDDIIISGHTQTLKPDPTIFHEFLIKHNPEDLVFIDDQSNNRDVAYKLGIQTKQSLPLPINP